jgi:hypothetical protein
LSGVIAVGSTVKVLVDYRPAREDEVAASRGELVQVVEVSPGANVIKLFFFGAHERPK